MKELIEKVSKETGLTPEQAEKAIQSVSSYIKMKSPTIFHEQLDTLLNGGTMMDGVKKKVHDIADELEDAAKNVGNKISDIFKK